MKLYSHTILLYLLVQGILSKLNWGKLVPVVSCHQDLHKFIDRDGEWNLHTYWGTCMKTSAKLQL